MENSAKNSSDSPLDPNLSQASAQPEPKTEDKPLKPRLSVQERWGEAAERAIEAGKKMTHSQKLLQFRLNSGYIVTAIHELPKPGMSASRKSKKHGDTP